MIRVLHEALAKTVFTHQSRAVVVLKRGGQSLGGRTIAKTFEGIGALWLLVGLAAAGLLAFGSHKLIVDLVDRPPATCPLEVPR